MVGFYPDVPAHRMAYDRDGTVGMKVDTAGLNPIMLSAGELANINDEDDDVVTLGDPDGHGLILLFPELRDITGIFLASPTTGGQTVALLSAFTSVDTTNGSDGTWVNRTYAENLGVVRPGYRTSIDTVSWLGIRAVRLHFWTPAGNNAESQVGSVHLYGALSAGQNPDRLRIWHPTLDQEIGGAYFDWGDVRQSSSADKEFRVKNNSATLTANTPTVSVEALSDTTPSVPGQHLLSQGFGFAATQQIGTLAPGAISPVLTLRRATASNAGLWLWAPRLKAVAASWS